MAIGFRFVCVAAWLLTSAVCTGGDDGMQNNEPEPTPTCDDKLEPSKALGEECCLDYGLDACAPDHFGAVLDGRTIASCYEDGSREAGESCDAHSNCDGDFCIEASNTCGFYAADTIGYNEYLTESEVEEALNGFLISTGVSSNVAWEGDDGAYVISHIEIGARIDGLQECPLKGAEIKFGNGVEALWSGP